ncbi:MAG: hypothetical protein ACHREM_04655 [Polyangiales bacterium]
MSVLACDRAGCDEVMCDRLILEGTAYVCDSCWRELLKYKESWPETMPLADVRERMKAFMRTKPGSFYEVGKEEIDAEFARLTR